MVYFLTLRDEEYFGKNLISKWFIFLPLRS
jgi:hypothetical protein